MKNQSEKNINKEINSKQKILDSAEEVFSEKGFDGARVDEIAKRARVNKALLYYYFESKEKLLQELVNINIDEAIRIKEEAVKKAKSFDNIVSGDVMDILPEFLKAKSKFLKILFMKALKEGDENA